MEDAMSSRFVLALGLIVFLSTTHDAFAQVSSATLSGVIVDESKAVLPGATIMATERDTGRQYAATADQRGEYRLVNIVPGTYKVQVELAGFATTELPDLVLLVGQNATAAFTLKVATLAENVTVTSQPPLIDTQNSQVAGNVDRHQIEALPLQGRNWMTLSMLVKGITANDVSTSPGVGRDELFELNLDGQQVTQHLGQARYGQPKFSQEAIAEFQIVTQLFDITEGRSTGIQVRAITKAGTNNVSGSGFGFFRDDKLNAADAVAKRVLPYSDKQVGGSLGGPILRDKVHFFGAFEHETELTTAVSQPTFLPGQVWSFPSENSYKSALGRVDYQMSTRGHISLRANHSSFENPFAATGGNTHPSRATVQSQNSTSVLGTWSRVIGNSRASELRLGYNAFEFGNDEPSFMAGVPQLSFPGVTLGAPSNQPNHFYQRQYQAHYDLSWFGGGHNVKVGGEFFRLNDTGYWFVVGAGNYIFNARPPDLLSRFPMDAWNNPAQWNLSGLDPYVREFDKNFNPYNWQVRMPQTQVGLWFGDTWRLAEPLTINYGVRWDADFGLVNPPTIADSTILIDNGIQQGDFGYRQGKTDLSNVAPRVGFNYKAGGSGDLVVRGGTGLYYAFPADNITYIKELYANMVSVAILNDGQPGFFKDPLRGLTDSQVLSGAVKLPPQTKVILDPNFKNPFTWQYSLGFQKQVNSVTSFDSDLIGWRWSHDQRDYDVNLFFDPATGYQKDPAKSGRPNAAYGPVWLTVSTGKRDYLALANSITRRLKNNLQAGATYTLMFYMHDDNLGGSGALSGPANNQFNYLDGEWARSTDFQRHTVRLHALYQLPWDVSVSGLYYFGSGNRFQTSLSQVTFGEGTNRLNLAAPIAVPAAGLDRFDGPGVIATGAIVPRNALRGLPLHRVDLRLKKDFRIARSLKISAIGEVFNVFNHANYGTYNGVVDSPTFGQPLQVSAFSGTGTAYVPRSGQLAFRVTF
jgi:hypothetical protein